jgi:hypothetical protein
MWNIKTTGIPEIIWVTGTISESFRKYLIRIPGKHDIKELQNRAILSTAHILLMWKYTTLNMGRNITCSMFCNHTAAATSHTLETRFVSCT